MGNQPVTPRVRRAGDTTTKFRPTKEPSQARTYGYSCGCCLRQRVSYTPVPIERVSVDVNIVYSLAEVTVKQIYKNDSASPIECTFDFSVGDTAVLSSLVVVVDGKQIRAQVQEKEEAFAAYDDAISSGYGAYLLESTDKANHYKLNVGNLPPTKKAEVEFTYVSPLTASQAGWLFSIPDTLFPKHMSYVSSLSGRVDVGEPIEAIEILSAHSDAIKTDATSFKYSPEDPALAITSEISMEIKVKMPKAQTDPSQATVEALTKPSLVVEYSPSEPTMFASVLDFTPVFASNTPELASDFEFVVLADVSGAMYGPKMRQQVNALKLLAHSLPSGSKFNLISVGNNFISRWQTSVVLDEENLRQALWTIDHLAAEDGDSRLRGALNSVFLRRDYSRALCVFLLTSIDYSPETRAIVKLVETHAARNARVFCLGFGDEVDSELLNSIAFVGRGRAHFVKEDELVDGLLFNQLVAAFAPRVRDMRVTWNLDGAAKAQFVDQSPLHVPITAYGASTLVYGLFEVPLPEGVVIPAEKPQVQAQDAKESASAAEATTSASSSAPSDSATSKKSKSSSKVSASQEPGTKDASAASPTSPRKHKKKGTADADSSKPLVDPLPPVVIPEGLKMPFTSVTIQGIGPDGKALRWDIDVKDAKIRAGRMIHAVAASKVCGEFLTEVRTKLLSQEVIKQKIIAISLKFQVLSKYTSLVAIEEREGEASEAAMVNVNIQANDEKNMFSTIYSGIELRNLQPPIIAPFAPQPLNILISPPIIAPQPHPPPPPVHIQPLAPGQQAPPPPPPAAASGPAFGGSGGYGGRKCRSIPSRAHWSPPAAAPTHHYVAEDKALFRSEAPPPTREMAYSFSSEKQKKKEIKNDTLDSASSSSRAPNSFATSSLGFSPKVSSNDCEDNYESIMNSAPTRFRLAPTAPNTLSATLTLNMDLDERYVKKEAEASHSVVSVDDSEDGEWEALASEETYAPPQAPAKAKKDVSRQYEQLPGRGAKSRYSDNRKMVPNKTQLDWKDYTPPPAAAQAAHEVAEEISLSAPSSWTYDTAKRSSTTSAPTSQHADLLRSIITAQRAAGSWDASAVALLLHIELAALETANPLNKDKKNEKSAEPKSSKAGKKSKHDKHASKTEAEAPSAEVTDKEPAKEEPTPTSTTDAAPSTEAGASPAPATAAPLPIDIWATAVLFSYLKAHFDAEKEFWTFVSLKVSSWLASSVPAEEERSALMKKASKYVSALAAPVSA